MKCRVNDKIWVEAKVRERHGVGVSKPICAEFENGNSMWLDEKEVLTEQDLEAKKEEAHQEGFEEGLEEAWELVKKIREFYCCRSLEDEELYIFGCYFEDVFSKYTVQEALTKVKEYEKKQEEIEVGDVVESEISGKKCIVTRNRGDGTVYAVFCDGSGGVRCKSDFKKTGKRIDIQSILDEIREE